MKFPRYRYGEPHSGKRLAILILVTDAIALLTLLYLTHQQVPCLSTVGCF